MEIYGLGIFSKVFKTYEEWAGERLLTEITEATGGHTVTINDVQKLPEIAANLSRELRSQYRPRIFARSRHAGCALAQDQSAGNPNRPRTCAACI